MADCSRTNDALSGHLPALHVGRNHALVLARAGVGAVCLHLVGVARVSRSFKICTCNCGHTRLTCNLIVGVAEPRTIVWTAGSTISVQVINDIGMSIGQGVWSGWVALTSLLWGAFGHNFFPVFTAVTMRSRPGAFVGLALLLTGIALLAVVGGAVGKVRPI